jgi:hypothetical protein
VCRIAGLPSSRSRYPAATGAQQEQDDANTTVMVFLKASQPVASNSSDDQSGGTASGSSAAAAAKPGPVVVVSAKASAGAQSAKKVDSTLSIRATLMGRDIATALIGSPQTGTPPSVSTAASASAIDVVTASLRDLKVDDWDTDGDHQAQAQVSAGAQAQPPNSDNSLVPDTGTNSSVSTSRSDTSRGLKDFSVLLRGLPTVLMTTTSTDWFAKI